MILENHKKGEKSFRRISKARLFDGDPLKISAGGAALMGFICISITTCMSFIFSYIHESGYKLVLWTLLPGVLLGIALLVLERSLSRLKVWMYPGMGRLLTAFLLFFLHIIGYLAFSSLLITYPMGFVMEGVQELTGIAREYSLFSVNFFIVLAILSWYRNVRSEPSKCI
jgi:hypothetical protein